MTSSNVEFLRGVYRRWERGDFSSADWADPELELEIVDGPTPGRWRGLPAVAQAWGEAIAPFAELTVAAEEYRELDGERVLVMTRNEGRGKTSGVDIGRVHTRSANLFHIRNGTVVKLVLYFDREAALADLSAPDS